MKRATLLFSTAAIALTPFSTAHAGDAMLGSTIPSLLRLMGALIVVVAAMYVGAYILKRSRGRSKLQKNKFIKVLEAVPIGQKTKLIAVELGDKVMVLGASENSLNRLAIVHADKYRDAIEDTDPDVIPFRSRLMALTKK